MVKGIDVSDWQGVKSKIDWQTVKGTDNGFAILKCGYGDDIARQDDKDYAYNIGECERLGIPYGVYLYSYIDSEAHLQSEIAHTLRMVQGHKPFCVYLDLEGNIYRQGKAKLTDFALRWCAAIQNAGYKAGVYASSSWFDSYIDIYAIYNAGYSIWVAQYANNPPNWNGINYDIWQYTSDGSVAGINGRVDCNYLYNTALLGKYNICGSLDEAGKDFSRGWAYNGVDDTPVTVQVYATAEDGTQHIVAITEATEYREDLKQAGVGNGYHAFYANCDFAALGVGKYTVTANGVVGDEWKQLSGEHTVEITEDDIPKPDPAPTEPPTETPPSDDTTGDTTSGIIATLKKLIRLIIEWAFGGKNNE